MAHVHSGYVMVAQATAIGMGVGWFSRLRRGVQVLAMPDASRNTTCRVGSAYEVLPGAGVLRLLVPRIEVGVYIDRRCVADGVEVTC